MDSTVGREPESTDMEGFLLWARKGVVFSWVVDVGILLDFSSVFSFGGETRLVERELLLLVAESVVVCCGVSEFELELEL